MCTDGERVRAVLAVQLPRGTGRRGARPPRSRSVSKIWLPMWLCSPTSDSAPALSTRRAASAASLVGPPAIEKPNFWSSCAVAMNSWVCASTPDGQPDHHRRASRPRSRATASSRAISWKRVEHDAADARLDRRDQLVDRLVVAVERDPLRREARPQRDRQLAAAADVQRTAPRRRPSGRPPCTGTPWPRSAPTDAPNAAANSGGTACGSRPRRRRTAACRTASARSRTSTPASSTTPVVAAAGTARPHRRGERVQVGGVARARARRLGRGQHTGVQRPGGMSVHLVLLL